jgi:hypothetical protein
MENPDILVFFYIILLVCVCVCVFFPHKHTGAHTHSEINISDTKRASCLESCLPSWHSVCPAAWAAVLLTVKKTSVEYAVIINDLPLLSICELLSNLLVLLIAIADAILWASGRRIGVEQMFPTRLVQKPSSIPTLLPARPSLVHQDNLSVQYSDSPQPTQLSQPI